jgi:hypothetical protein
MSLHESNQKMNQNTVKSMNRSERREGKNKSTGAPQSQTQVMNLGGQLEDSGLHSQLEKHSLHSHEFVYVDLENKP